MKLILTKAVKNLGIPGQTIEVNDGYARNFLLPKNLGFVFGSAGAASFLKEKGREKSRKEKQISDEDKIISALSGKNLVIARPGTEKGVLYASVTAADLIKEIKSRLHLEVPERMLDMAPLKTAGLHKIPFRSKNNIGSLNVNINAVS